MTLGSLGAIRASRCAYSSAERTSPASRLKLMSASRVSRCSGWRARLSFRTVKASAAASGRMQRYCMDIGVSRLVRCQFGGAAQFANRLIELLAPDQCQAERVVNPRILWNCIRRGAKNALAVGFPPQVPVEVGEVNCCRRVLSGSAEGRLCTQFPHRQSHHAERGKIRAWSALPVDRR